MDSNFISPGVPIAPYHKKNKKSFFVVVILVGIVVYLAFYFFGPQFSLFQKPSQLRIDNLTTVNGEKYFIQQYSSPLSLDKEYQNQKNAILSRKGWILVSDQGGAESKSLVFELNNDPAAKILIDLTKESDSKTLVKISLSEALITNNK